MNIIRSTSYVTYQYEVYPRTVERHVSSNVIETSINGANLKISSKFIQSQKDKKNIVIYSIFINNDGNKTAYCIKLMNILNNLSFIKDSLMVNKCKVENYDFNEGFFFKQLKPKDCINITFIAKINPSSDITNFTVGSYYFINDRNEKIYRKASSNINKITVDYSDLTFNMKYDQSPLTVNNSKNLLIYLSNTGNKEAFKIKLNILLPKELKLKANSILVSNKSVLLDDEYGFFVENLKPNESQKINFEIEFIEFKNRYIVPIAMFCSFYNINEDNLLEQYDSKIYKTNIKLNQ